MAPLLPPPPCPHTHTQEERERMRKLKLVMITVPLVQVTVEPHPCSTPLPCSLQTLEQTDTLDSFEHPREKWLNNNVYRALDAWIDCCTLCFFSSPEHSMHPQATGSSVCPCHLTRLHCVHHQTTGRPPQPLTIFTSHSQPLTTLHHTTPHYTIPARSIVHLW